MMTTMPIDHRRALQAFAARVRDLFGTRVRHLRLFGSWARGTAGMDSDIDVAVVVDDLTRDQWRTVIDAATDVELVHDVVLGPYVVSSAHFAELTRRGRALATAIVDQGVAL